MAGVRGVRRHGGAVLGPVIASVAVLLVGGCMTGPIPVSSNRARDNGANASGPSEEKLPAAPAVRSSPP